MMNDELENTEGIMKNWKSLQNSQRKLLLKVRDEDKLPSVAATELNVSKRLVRWMRNKRFLQTLDEILEQARCRSTRELGAASNIARTRLAAGLLAPEPMEPRQRVFY